MEENIKKVCNIDTEEQEKLMYYLLEEDIEEVCDMVDTFLGEELRLMDNNNPCQEDDGISSTPDQISDKECESKEQSIVEPWHKEHSSSSCSSTVQTSSLNRSIKSSFIDTDYKNETRTDMLKSRKAKSSRVRSKKRSKIRRLQENTSCIYCYETGHMIFSCTQFLDLSLKERIGFIEDRKRCYSCFGKHLWQDCLKPSVCQHCQASHNSILCRYSASGSTSEDHFDWYPLIHGRFYKEPQSVTGPRSELNIAAESNKQVFCLYCLDTQHTIFVCQRFLRKSVKHRRAKANALNLCCLCLGKHTQKCRERFNCSHCQGNHHSLLCFRLLLYPDYRSDKRQRSEDLDFRVCEK